MKKYTILLLFIFSASIYSQTITSWVDPFNRSDAPGWPDAVEGNKAVVYKDYNKAISCFEKAGQKGSLYAVTMLGVYYLEGNHVTKNVKKAFEYFVYAADRGYAPAQCNLGYLFFSGEEVEKDEKRAFDFFKKSMEQGYPEAIGMVAKCYIEGKGTPQNTDKGIELLSNLGKNGEVEAQLYLGNYYERGREDYINAYKWYNLAAGYNRPEALFRLAVFNLYGRGMPIDYENAHKYYKKTKLAIENSTQFTDDQKRDFYFACLEGDGTCYLHEGNSGKAEDIWNELKAKYPQKIEEIKYDAEREFIQTMFKLEKENYKTSITSNNSKKLVEPVIVSDIDEIIPENSVTGSPTFAVIIANENYSEVETVPYAVHDGDTFKKYCEKTLGIPQSNIKFVEDATLNNIKRQLTWLGQVMEVYQGEANIIFYYAGHGIPNESNGSAYLLPVDGVGNDVSTGYSLDKLYAELSSKPAKSVVVLLDACFSGAKRDGGMLASARGVAIKAKQNAPKGNMLVLSAAQGDETAYPFKEKGHGMFTYYLLKKLQETKGDVTFGELADYVTTEVKKQSIVTNGKMQTPLATPSSNATDWRNWKLR